jgi:glycosyltransferase involved in cell wall biosynthesis
MKTSDTFIFFVQPALPTYRLAFFDRLHRETGGRIRVYYSPGGLGALTEHQQTNGWEYPIGKIVGLPLGLDWQRGTFRVRPRRGDILVVSGAPRTLSNFLLIFRGRLSGAKIVWWGHYWSSTSRKWRLGLRRALMRFADAVLFYTEREVSEYLAGCRDNRPVAGLNNGIDTESIRNSREPYVAATRPSASLFIGRLSEKASLESLFKAMMDKRLASMSLHVVGWGELGPQLQEITQNYGIADRVVWHGALTDEIEIGPVANKCRIFVYPGPVGLSLIHAMAYGLPTVVHGDRWRHGPEIAAFEEGKTGRTFAPGDYEDLADVLVEVLANSEVLDQYSKRCTEVTARSFNTDDMARRFLVFVERIL